MHRDTLCHVTLGCLVALHGEQQVTAAFTVLTGS
jgi:hypothetical protein